MVERQAGRVLGAYKERKEGDSDLCCVGLRRNKPGNRFISFVMMLFLDGRFVVVL